MSFLAALRELFFKSVRESWRGLSFPSLSPRDMTRIVVIFRTDLDIYHAVREQIEREDNLITQRVT